VYRHLRRFEFTRRQRQARVRRLAQLECLRYHKHDVLRFASDLLIPPTSNQHAISGYISTAANDGENALTALRDSIPGQPWMPPIPEPPRSLEQPGHMAEQQQLSLVQG